MLLPHPYIHYFWIPGLIELGIAGFVFRKYKAAAIVFAFGSTVSSYTVTLFILLCAAIPQGR
jgi:hypothetical protein